MVGWFSLAAAVAPRGLAILLVTFLGWLSDPFKWLSDHSSLVPFARDHCSTALHLGGISHAVLWEFLRNFIVHGLGWKYSHHCLKKGRKSRKEDFLLSLKRPPKCLFFCAFFERPGWFGKNRIIPFLSGFPSYTSKKHQPAQHHQVLANKKKSPGITGFFVAKKDLKLSASPSQTDFCTILQICRLRNTSPARISTRLANPSSPSSSGWGSYSHELWID